MERSEVYSLLAWQLKHRSRVVKCGGPTCLKQAPSTDSHVIERRRRARGSGPPGDPVRRTHIIVAIRLKKVGPEIHGLVERKAYRSTFRDLPRYLGVRLGASALTFSHAPLLGRGHVCISTNVQFDHRFTSTSCSLGLR